MIRRKLVIFGTVQGVGFRPFVHTLAHKHRLGGFVRNDGDVVVIEVEGSATGLDAFTVALKRDAPALANVENVQSQSVDPIGEREFTITLSRGAGRSNLIPPDIATCDDCLAELFDPGNRRFRYPFINCTQCGPRFTIVRATPYDRANTTMANFTMCAACRQEYEDPASRRFHAEPIACAECGPILSLNAAADRSIAACDNQRGPRALEGAVATLQAGGIVAVKGVGGYHLACDASSEVAVQRLRERKQRDCKPFALMTTDPEAIAIVSTRERDLLHSPPRPIVLLRRRVSNTHPIEPLAWGTSCAVAEAIAPNSQWLGVMLPYTPLHHLLLADFGRPLVMTSANIHDEPIVFEDRDARKRLSAIADAFLSYNRVIHRRCEDSVVRADFPIRRARGYVPTRLTLPHPARADIVAVGGELKSTFCIARGRDAWLSPHMGDLSSLAAFSAFQTDLALYAEMLEVKLEELPPLVIACDLHPEYLSSKWAREQPSQLVEVQHHHAHAAACLAEHGEPGPALALIFDGVGYGPDGTLWGGELLRCDLKAFERLASLEPIALPGAEAAIHEPWRVAASYLERAGRPVPFERWPVVRESMRVNAPLSSGMGRLFDAGAALLGAQERVSYEGQAAIELEQLAGSTVAAPYGCRIEGNFIIGADLIAAIHDDVAAERPRAEIAAAFHEGVADVAARACEIAAHPRVVVLSGGCFQNVRLLRSVQHRLTQAGFRVLTHRRVPPNDGGLSYGQAAVAAATLD